MKKHLSLFAVILACAACSGPMRVSSILPPEVGVPTEALPDLQACEEKYGRYGGFFFYYEDDIEHVTPGWSVYRVTKRKYLVLNPDAVELTTFEFQIDASGFLSEAYLRVTSPEGAVEDYGLADINLLTDSDGTRTYKFAYPNVQKGSIIEERFEVAYEHLLGNPVFDHFVPLQFAMPCEKVRFRFICPVLWKVKIKRIGKGKILPTKKTYDENYGRNILSYEAENVQAVTDEPYSPYYKEMADYIELKLTEVIFPSTHYKASKDWQELVTEFKRYVIEKDPVFSRRVTNTTKEIIRECRTPYDKLEAIIGYLQKEISPTISALEGNYADLLKRREGNPFMITGLALMMLAEADIQAQYLLIHSAEEGYFDQKFISLAQLHIPGIYVKLEGTLYVVFPYIRNLPVNLIPEYMEGQRAMKIYSEGYDHFMDVPSGDLTLNHTEEEYDLSIHPDSTIRVEEKKVMRGSFAYSARLALSMVKDDEVDKALKEFLTYTEGDVTIQSKKIENLDDYTKPLIITLTYKIDNLVTTMPEEVIFQTGGLFSPSSKAQFLIDPEERNNPIRIHRDERYKKNITLRFPENWDIHNTFEDYQHENTFGEIWGAYEISEGRLEVTQQLTLKRADRPKEEIGEFLEIAGSVSKHHVPSIIFTID